MARQRGRSGLSPAARAELWERWRRGERLTDIATHLQRTPIGVYQHVRRCGGVAERPRHRASQHLQAAEREVISRGVTRGASFQEIGRELGRPASTVSREVGRNGGRGAYRAVRADRAAWERAERPKPCKLAQHPGWCRLVAAKLEAKWSPQQIAGWLQRQHPLDPAWSVSHETIYRTLFVQTRGVLKRELLAHLRTQRTERRRRTKPADRRGQIHHAVSIRERPADVEDRAIPGHWEGDLITGTRHASHLATLVERTTRFVMLVKVNSKEARHVAQRLQRKILRLPTDLTKTLTWDRGHEMAEHEQFTIDTGLQVYFCDPQSPWQRGTNENTNGLLRQYFPKSMDLAQLTQQQLDKVARELNNRPRATLDFMSPAEKFNELLR